MLPAILTEISRSMRMSGLRWPLSYVSDLPCIVTLQLTGQIPYGYDHPDNICCCLSQIIELPHFREIYEVLLYYDFSLYFGDLRGRTSIALLNFFY
jgi:hypothetical protein